MVLVEKKVSRQTKAKMPNAVKMPTEAYALGSASIPTVQARMKG